MSSEAARVVTGRGGTLTPMAAQLNTETPAPAGGGWAFPTPEARKVHYFPAPNGRSLCGKYGSFGLTLQSGTGTGGIYCTACNRKLAERRLVGVNRVRNAASGVVYERVPGTQSWTTTGGTVTTAQLAQLPEMLPADGA